MNAIDSMMERSVPVGTSAIRFLVQAPLLYLAEREPRGAWLAMASASSRGGGRELDPVFEYDGSTFSEVKEVAWRGPYAEPLPVQRGLRPGKFIEFFNHSTRNLIDRRDVLPYFEKLIHTNGICFTGTWRIDTKSPYTGYFAEGAEGLLLVRGSVAGPALTAGDAGRSAGRQDLADARPRR